MPFLAANILKVLLVAALYGFLFYVARAMRGQVIGPPAAAQTVRAGAGDATPAPAPPIPLLVLRRADGTEIRRALEHPILIGRGVGADLQLDDDFASDRHARVEFDGTTIWIEDLGSTNGTTVNGSPVTGRIAVRRGTSLTIGRTKMVLQ